MRDRLARFLVSAILLGGLVLSLETLAHTPALAQQIGIAAVVNDEAITTADVDARVHLALLGAGGEPSPETLKRMRDQILQNMIDEKIQMQEAKRRGVDVDEATIDQEVNNLARQNNIPEEQLAAFFASKGVPISALRNQIRASIAWARVVQRTIRPRIAIGDDEVDAEVARLKASMGEPEYLLGDIFLPVDRPGEDDKVYQTAIRLIEQMARGARFSAIARQFSQDFSAASGGDLGWVHLGELDPDLAESIRKMSAGTVSPPVRTAQGYHIVMLRQIRDAAAALAGKKSGLTPENSIIDLRQLIVPGFGDKDIATLKELHAKANSCASMEEIAGSLGMDNKGIVGKVKFSSLPDGMKPMLKDLPVNVPSAPFKNEKGLMFVMICDRSWPEEDLSINRDEITNEIGNKKLELQARRYLRDLRQESFVEIR